jgi:hypothetical protein
VTACRLRRRRGPDSGLSGDDFLIVASTGWLRLTATSIAAVTVIAVSGARWHGPWVWWTVITVGLCLSLASARLPHVRLGGISGR